MKEETVVAIVETVVGIWVLAMAVVLFAAPFVAIGMVIAYLWGAA